MRTTARSIGTLLAGLAVLTVTLAAGVAPVSAQTGGPTVTVTPSADLDPAGQTVTISGSGFGASDGVYVRLCAEAAGDIGTAEGRPGADRCLDDPQHWVSNFPGATAPMVAGSFTVQLEVVGTFTGSEGESFDCRVVQCGIATRRDHVGGASDYSLDTFTPISFAAGDPGPDPDPDPDPDPGPADPPPSDPSGDGELDWGVKESFRNYIENGPASGSIETTAPASRNEDGTFRFPVGDGADYQGPADVSAPFEGGVHFSGHGGQLDLVITEPRVDIDGDAGTLVVDAVSKELESTQSETFDDVVMATLDLSAVDPTADGDRVRFAEIPATLTEEGAEAFGGFYEAGEALDPLTLTLQVDDTDGLAPTPGPVADTVGCIPTSVVAGQSVDVCAAGFTAGEQVQVFLHSAPVFLSVVQADDAGEVAAPVVIPSDAVGSHRLELRGVTSGRSIFSDTFTVTAATAQARLPETGGDTSILVAMALLGFGVVALRLRVRARP